MQSIAGQFTMSDRSGNARRHRVSRHIEYELTDYAGDLVNCMTWRELLDYLPGCYQPGAVRKAIQRGTVIDGLTIVKVVYDDEDAELN